MSSNDAPVADDQLMVERVIGDWSQLALALNQHAIVSITNRKGNILYANPMFCQVSGYTQAELIGQNHRIVKSGQHSEHFYRYMWRTIASGNTWKGEVCNRRKNGSLYWVESTITPIVDETGQVERYISIRTDITANVIAEQSLKHSNQLRQDLNDIAQRLLASPLECLQTEIESALLHSANSWSAPLIAFYLAEENSSELTLFAATGTPSVTPNAIHESVVQHLERLTSSGYLPLSEIETSGGKFPTGLLVPIMLQEKLLGTLLFLTERNETLWWQQHQAYIDLFSGMISSAVQRHQIAQQLARTQQRFSIAVEGAGDAVWEYDIAQQAIYYTHQVNHMLGLNSNQLSCSPLEWKELLHPEDRERVFLEAENCLFGLKSSYNAQARMRCQDGRHTWILFRGAVTDWADDGRPSRMVGIMSDISDIKSKEAELIAARNEADKANQSKSRFLSNMSHELRTPLNAILGFGQLLEMEETLNAEQTDYVEEILKAGHHLLDLINEVLDLAKVESGKVNLNLEALSISDLLADCSALIQPLATQHNIGLDLSHFTPGYVHADKTRVKQVLINLLSNAIKYNRKQGRVSVSSVYRQQNVRISIRDTGFGIAPGDLETLFEPFNRLAFENSSIEGTGIGLALTKRLIENMNGSIGVSSTVGEGTEFWVELPSPTHAPSRTAAQSLTPATQSPAQALSTPISILYVDDNPSNLKLVRKALSEIPNVHYRDCNEPDAGIRSAFLYQPDLILLDINMPGMSGYDVLKTLRDSTDFCDTPIIAVTANATAADIERGLAAGFNDYLSKPFDLLKLMRLLHKHLPERY